MTVAKSLPHLWQKVRKLLIPKLFLSYSCIFGENRQIAAKNPPVRHKPPLRPHSLFLSSMDIFSRLHSSFTTGIRFLFLSLLPQGRMPLGFLAEERTPHDCTTFSRRRGLPAPGSAALSAAAGRPQLHRFPRRRRHRSATFPRGEQTAIPLSSRRRMNRLSTAIDFVDNNMPEIYLIYISCRTIFATATRINNTNI